MAATLTLSQARQQLAALQSDPNDTFRVRAGITLFVVSLLALLTLSALGTAGVLSGHVVGWVTLGFTGVFLISFLIVNGLNQIDFIQRSLLLVTLIALGTLGVTGVIGGTAVGVSVLCVLMTVAMIGIIANKYRPIQETPEALFNRLRANILARYDILSRVNTEELQPILHNELIQWRIGLIYAQEAATLYFEQVPDTTRLGWITDLTRLRTSLIPFEVVILFNRVN